MQAVAASGYAFSYWENNTNNLSSLNNASTGYTAQFNDTITAHFIELYEDTLIIITQPAGAGTLYVGSDVITTTPFTGVYSLNNVLNIEAVPNANANFNQWRLASLSLPDYNTMSSFVFLHKDTLTAYFNAPTSINDLGEDVNYFTVYPTVTNGKFSIDYQLNKATNLSVQLVNMNGKLVKHWALESNTINTPLKKEFEFDGANGIYILQVYNEKTSSSTKLIKID